MQFLCIFNDFRPIITQKSVRRRPFTIPFSYNRYLPHLLALDGIGLIAAEDEDLGNYIRNLVQISTKFVINSLSIQNLVQISTKFVIDIQFLRDGLPK